MSTDFGTEARLSKVTTLSLDRFLHLFADRDAGGDGPDGAGHGGDDDVVEYGDDFIVRNDEHGTSLLVWSLHEPELGLGYQGSASVIAVALAIASSSSSGVWGCARYKRLRCRRRLAVDGRVPQVGGRLGGITADRLSPTPWSTRSSMRESSSSLKRVGIGVVIQRSIRIVVRCCKGGSSCAAFRQRDLPLSGRCGFSGLQSPNPTQARVLIVLSNPPPTRARLGSFGGAVSRRFRQWDPRASRAWVKGCNRPSDTAGALRYQSSSGRRRRRQLERSVLQRDRRIGEVRAAGWYRAEGATPNTACYWDGTQWIGAAVNGPTQTVGGFDLIPPADEPVPELYRRYYSRTAPSPESTSPSQPAGESRSPVQVWWESSVSSLFEVARWGVVFGIILGLFVYETVAYHGPVAEEAGTITQARPQVQKGRASYRVDITTNSTIWHVGVRATSVSSIRASLPRRERGADARHRDLFQMDRIEFPQSWRSRLTIDR